MLDSFASGLCPTNTPESLYAGQGIGCKPAFAAFRTPLVARARGRCLARTERGCMRRTTPRRVTIWGHVRPAQGPTAVQIRYRDRGGAPRHLRSVVTDSLGYFTFKVPNRRGRRWQAVWEGLKGPLVRAYGF